MRMHGGMKNTTVLLIAVAGVILGAAAVAAFYVPGGQVGRLRLYEQLSQGESPRRIVSLAPVITETLFALGMDHRLVGVTDYCDYPEAAKSKARVGGYYDPNFEAIAALRPDLVLLLPEHGEHRQRFQHLHLSTYTVDMDSLGGILSTFIQLGFICRQEARGCLLADDFRRRLLAAKAASAGYPRRRVVLVIGRDYGDNTLREVYMAGQGTFYDQLLEVSGGVNAFQQPMPKYPKISMEGLLALAPEVIIELVPQEKGLPRPLEALRSDWSRAPGLQAQCHILAGSYTVRPGPRLMQLLDALTTILHPAAGPP